MGKKPIRVGRIRGGLALAALALATACGSTVSPGTVGAAGSGLDPLTGLSDSGRSSSTPSATDGPTASATQSTDDSASPSATAEGSVADGASTPSDINLPTLDSKKPLSVAFFVAGDVGAALAALGFNGLSTGDGEVEAKAAIKLVNSLGGIGGRQIAPVIYKLDENNASSSSWQEACSLFFEDNHVQAVVSVFHHPILASCAAKHHVGIVTAGMSSVSASTLAANSSLVLSHVMSIDDVAAQLTASLVRTRFFATSKTTFGKIGLITMDSPDFKNVEGIVRSGLQKAGLTLTSASKMPANDQDGARARAATAGQSASLKFKVAGITHVIAVDSNGFSLSWFGIGAAANGYYPKYGLSSLDNAGALAQSANDQSLGGAQGIGWAPMADQVPRDQPTLGDHSISCQRAMTQAGLDMGTASTRQIAVGTCDAVFLLAAILKSADPSLASFTAGLKALGSSYKSAMVFATNFNASRGAARGYRAMAYVSSCKCFRYSSGTTTF